ncbi:MAG: pyridoxal 5'-phosphate synthase glutaminase subunit PdxT [Armatimonadetes bacterium]|nr:pyridoxal 5'-phosphate synthase glutaminase subunit PdxT [Armatimonadota bacterium]
MKIGVLALQGDFREHLEMLGRIGVEGLPIRTVEEFARTDGLIIPGGESTTVGKLMARYGLDSAITGRALKEGFPIYGTCAGLILLAKRIVGSDQARLGLMDVTVERNAYGRQVDSFEAEINVPAIGDTPVQGVFIRAPVIREVSGSAEALARFEDHIVLARQGNLLAGSFHPELTDDDRVHRYFADIVSRTPKARA